MFDIGFWELTLIGLVALIVIGPDKLPGLARTAGLWIGKMRYFINNVKADINRELKTDELRNALQNNADIDELKQILNSTRDTLNTQIKPDYLVKSDNGGQTAVTDATADDIASAQNPPVTSAPAIATGQDTPSAQPEHAAPAFATGQDTPGAQPEHAAPAFATGQDTPGAQPEHTAPASATGQGTPGAQPEHTAPASATGQDTPGAQPEHTAPASATGQGTHPPIASATTTDDTVAHDKTRHP